MPIVVRPEDIRLPKRKLRKDILYRLGLEEGKQIGLEEGKQIGLEEGKQIGLQEGKHIGLEEGLLKSAQEMLIAIIEAKLGYVPEGLEERVKEIKDREFLSALIKRLVKCEDVLKVSREEIGL